MDNPNTSSSAPAGVPVPPSVHISRPLSQAPLVGIDVLKRHHAHVPSDHRFAAAARLLQCLWREEAGLPIGTHSNPRAPKGKRHIKLGSRLAPEAARTGMNFISPEIFALVRRELVLREVGAAYDVGRLLGNALSSVPLMYNLIGGLALDPAGLGTSVFRQLFPDFVEKVHSIAFETSPGRGDPKFLNDYTAFDTAVRVTTVSGTAALLFLEIKNAEGFCGPVALWRPRYDEVSQSCGLFIEHAAPDLRRASQEQFWRQAMLAQQILDRGGGAVQGKLVVIHPRLNYLADEAAARFCSHLVDPTGTSPHADGSQRLGFEAITVESVIVAIALAGAAGMARQLYRRYANFELVAEVALRSLHQGAGTSGPDDAGPGASPAGVSVEIDDTVVAAKCGNPAVAPIRVAPDAPIARSPSTTRRRAGNRKLTTKGNRATSKLRKISDVPDQQAVSKRSKK